ERVTQLLNAGEVVCLFPEGIITRTGHMNEFKRGYERAAENAQGVILPFYLHGLWGSRFARSSDKLKMTRRAGGKLDIVVSFGEQLAMTTKADELKRIVFDLSITSWEEYSQTLSTLPNAWIDTVKRCGKQRIASDATSGTLTANKVLTGAICFSRLIEHESSEQNVGLLLPPANGAAIANMAVLLRGKTVVNLNYTASEDALLSAIEQSQIKSIYTSRKFISKLKTRGIDLDNVLGQCKALHMEDLKEQISTPIKLITLLAIKCLPAFLLRKMFCKRVDAESTAAILFSSGSEGAPKGVMLSHRNLMANLKQTADVLNIQETDKVVATLPQFHAFGLTVTTFLPLIEGLPVIYHPDPTDVVNVSQLVAKHRATILLGTSTFLRLYNRNRQVEPLTLNSLRLVVAGAEKLNAEVRDAFKQKFGKDIYEGFGATETAPVASVNLPDSRDPITGRIHRGTKIGTVGMPLPGTAFRVVDPDTFATLPLGEDGHILIAGPQVMTGYLNNEEKTAEAVAVLDGQRWFKTGDKGCLDEDGFLTIVDRYSRFAKLGGEMVSLAAVEDQIRSALNQSDLELVAVNLPDNKKGERIVALVVSNIEPTQIKKVLVQSNCNQLMIPAEIRNIDEVPMLGSGKKDFATAKQLAMETPVIAKAA
ncbi:MAG: AMP-binding protein, partial [Gammaproteobacteria bacterium]|nr:AMP-binding protein [Gammaproteobacteria bacterium]